MLDVTADFGASGCPGTFHLFYFKGVVQIFFVMSTLGRGNLAGGLAAEGRAQAAAAAEAAEFFSPTTRRG